MKAVRETQLSLHASIERVNAELSLLTDTLDVPPLTEPAEKLSRNAQRLSVLNDQLAVIQERLLAQRQSLGLTQ